MKEEDLIKEARKRFKTLYDADYHLRGTFRRNMQFSFNIGEGHWDPTDKQARQGDDSKPPRPYLTANKFSKFVARVVNMERGIPDRDLVIPVDSKADPNTAGIYNQLIEDIEYHSDYDQVISTEGEYAVGGGYGYWRIASEWVSSRLEQVLRIKACLNPLMVNVERNKRYAFIREALSVDEYEEKYGEWDKPSSFESGDDDELWYEDEKIYIAEYFKRVPYKKTIAQTDTGETIEIDEKDVKKYKKTRTHNDHKVEWFKLCGHKVLEKGEWAGDEIPIIEVCGHKLWFEGKLYKKSLIDDAIDMMKAYNYWITSLTEKVALSPKAPFVLTEGQIRGHEKDWKRANIDPLPYLLVAQNPLGNKVERALSPEVGQGELLMLNITDNNIRDILGQFEASIGQTSNERSGKAIQARAAASDSVVYHFPDNLARAKRETKKMLIKLIPKYYDTERVIRLLGTDQTVMINQMTKGQAGEPVIKNDLSVGEYDIRANNPANPSLRQQTTDALREAMQYAGEGYAGIILPEFFKNLDLPGMQELSMKIEAQTAKLEQMKAMEANGGLPLM